MAAGLALALLACASSPPPPATSPPPAAAAAPERSGQVVPPQVETAQRLTSPLEPPYKPSVPKRFAVAGARYTGIYKICVSSDGRVAGVKPLKSAGEREVDDSFMTTLLTWRYRPLSVDGKAVPFCSMINLSVGFD
jgi:hypothetical protein